MMYRRPSPTMTTSREDGCYGSLCDHELTQYIPPRTSCTTFRRASHRTDEMTSSTLHRGLGGGLPRGGAPMLSTFEAAAWVECWAGEGSDAYTPPNTNLRLELVGWLGGRNG